MELSVGWAGFWGMVIIVQIWAGQQKADRVDRVGTAGRVGRVYTGGYS